MRSRRAVLILCSLVLIIAVAMGGCSGKKLKKTARDDVSKVSRTESEQKEAEASTYQAYLNVLNSNASEIKAYDWQNYNEAYTVNTKGLCPVAFTDVNGDGISEFFYFTSDGHVNAKLHLYSYVDGEPAEIVYGKEITDDSGTYSEGLFTDVYASAGTTYVLYTGTEEGTFYIYHTVGDDTKGYYIDKYFMNPKGMVSLDGRVSEIAQRKKSKWKEKYYIDGKKAGASKGKEQFESWFSDMKEILIYSVYDIDNPPPETIWQKVKEGNPIQLSHGDALNYVKSLISGETEETEKPDDSGSAVEVGASGTTGDVRYKVNMFKESQEDFTIEYDTITLESDKEGLGGLADAALDYESVVAREVEDSIISFEGWEGGGSIDHSILEVNSGDNYVSIQGQVRVYVEGLAYGWGTGISITYNPETGERYNICDFTGLSINELNARLKKNLPESGEIQKNVFNAFGYEHLVEPYASDTGILQNFYIDENGTVWLDHALYPPAFGEDSLPVMVGNISEF